MALSFSFRLRGASRDRQGDNARFTRLSTFLEQLSTEVAAERIGLKDRHDSAVNDAAFLLDSLDGKGSGKAKRVDDLSMTIAAFERRMENLQQQQRFLDDLRNTVASFHRSMTAEAENPAPARRS